jgi:hypothetical protein
LIEIGIPQMTANVAWNIRAFPAVLQGKRAVWTATTITGIPRRGQKADLAIVVGVPPHPFRRAH